MRKIWLWLFIIVFLAFSAEAKQRSFQGLTGTGTYPAVANLALDGWPVAGDAGPPIVTALAQGDFAHGHDNAGNYYTYVYNAASSAAEDVPDVITPNDSAGAGRWVRLGLGIIETLQMTPTTGIAHSEGLFYYDSVTKTFNVFNEEPDVTLNIGEELFIRVINNSGGDIANGEVCYLSGVDTGIPEIELAQANAAGTSLATIGISTHSIEDGTFGYITNSGRVREVDTTGFTAGQQLYLSATTPGGLVNVPPSSPNYLIGLGQAVAIDGSVGSLQVNVSVGTNTAGVIKIFNGSVLEDTATTVASTGGVVTLSYEQSGTGDLSLFFNGGFDAFDSTPAATIILTEGSDISPTLNYVYIPESTMLLTVSTVGFPSEQHVPVATALVQDGLSVETDGLYKLHAWTDHLSDTEDQGHLAHVNHWIREQHATWRSGAVPTTTVTVNGGAIDNVDFAVTAGLVLQLHDHAFPAIDTATTGHIYAINDATTAYLRITDLSSIAEDSTGASLRSNNTFYSLVIWGVVSESSGDSQLYVNEPSGFYISETGALNDANGYSNYSIPSDFKGTGFLVARVTLRYQTADSGTLTESETEDLRGLVPSTSAGGGGVSAGSEFSDNLFRIQNVLDTTKQIDFDVSGITTGTTRTIIWPDRNIDFGDNVSSSAAITDHSIVRGDGGVKGVQDSGVLIDDTDNMSGVVNFTLSGTLTSPDGVTIAGTAVGGQYYSMLEDTDLGTNYSGWGVFGDLATSTLYMYPLAAPTAGQVMTFAVPSNVTMSDGTTKSVSVGTWTTPATASAYASDTEMDFYGTILNPQGVYDNDSTNHAVSFAVNIPAAFTITAIYISCDADPTTEPTLTFQHKSAGVGYGSPTTIEAVTTTAGVASITSGIDDPTIPANTKLFITLSDPDDALNEITWQIKGDFD